jgi:(1->4)-alpha-D-glucan 1-alpha-D-glucosylmutase
LLSLNEVGGNPDQFGITRQSFHAFMAERTRKCPYALNASSTHDCKRGEDIRARLNVLSEIPEQWGKKVSDWRMLNREKKICIENELVPGDTEESFIYQTLSGSWPLNEDTHPPPYVERMEAYMVKSLREAKINSSWHMPNETYETAVKSFVRDILKPGPENRFLTQFLPFYRKVAHYGVFNTLSQTLVKLTAPGIPDFYQGAELMNLNLVDPDNRRPVDYQQRKALLQKLKTAIAANGLTPFPTSTELIEKADYLKLFIIIKGLQARTSYVNVFRDGAYLPLETTGQFNRHVVAFARQFENHWSITVIPRFLTGLVTPEQSPLGQSLWDDTAVLLPSGVPGSWQSVLDSRCLKAKNQLIVGKLFERFPAALLTGD